MRNKIRGALFVLTFCAAVSGIIFQVNASENYPGINLKTDKKEYETNDIISLELWRVDNSSIAYPVDIFVAKNLDRGTVEKKLIESSFNVSGHSFKTIDISKISYFSENGAGEYVFSVCKVNACTEIVNGNMVFNSNSGPDATFSIVAANSSNHPGINLKTDKKEYETNDIISLELWRVDNSSIAYPVDIFVAKNLDRGTVEKKLIESSFNVSGHSFKTIDISKISYFSENGAGEYVFSVCKVNACTEIVNGNMVFNSNSGPDATFSIVAANSSVISEQVKCVFHGAQAEQKCYAASPDNDNIISCSGKESCVVDIKRAKGESVTWKSTCGGYAYTIMDGQNESAEFDCATVVAPPPKPGATSTNPPKPIESNIEIIDMKYNAKNIVDDKYDAILAELKQLRNTVKEQQNEIKYLRAMTDDLRNISDKMKSAINDFITYGVDSNTVKLGAGERAAVINSYKSAFDKLPETEAELTDAIKIANGRFPSVISERSEKQAKEQFIKIYKREADLNDSQDNAAIKVMAYGLRQKAENRNLNSEKAGIKTFRSIYGRIPKTTADWNIMQAITYSGASR